MLDAVRQEQPRRPRSLNKEISPSLEAVVLKALHKHPNDRYADADTMAIDLERVLAGRPVLAKRYAHIDHFKYFVRKNRTVVLFLLVAMTLAATILTFSRESILNAKFELLLHQAKSINSKITLKKKDQPTVAWNEIREGRQAMMAGEFEEAARRLQLAVNISSQVNDHRTSAIARLDMARCETILRHWELALDLYKWIINNEDTSPAISSIAQLEYMTLQFLSGNKKMGLQALRWRELPPDGPLRDTVDGLTGEISPTDLSARILNMPRSFQNDARFIEGLTYFFEGDTQKAGKILKRCINESQPSSDWPAPFAFQLYKKKMEE
ncbi:MAG: hypothetical protein AAF492_32515 [Verrucomicrobiota bacterium]